MGADGNIDMAQTAQNFSTLSLNAMQARLTPAGIRVGDVQGLRRRLEAARRTHVTNELRRTKRMAELRGNIKRTSLLIIVAALCTAALADLLSIADLGWIVSWAIPVFTGIMAKRIISIKSGAKKLAAAGADASRAYAMTRKKVGPLLLAAGQRRSSSPPMRQAASRALGYWWAFARDTIIIQILELIPGISILPMYVGQVVKEMRDEKKEYRAAQPEFALLEQKDRETADLEKFEIRFLSALIVWVANTLMTQQRTAMTAYERNVEVFRARRAPPPPTDTTAYERNKEAFDVRRVPRVFANQAA